MNGHDREREHIETIVIGGGQAGLSVGYHLARRGLPFLILDANERIGDVWRGRWDSLRLFTPARYDGLDGLPFPAAPDTFPTKDEMADYLEEYAARHELAVETGITVDRVTKIGDRYLVEAGERRFETSNVVVAMGTYQRPKVPDLAGQLDPGIVQLHSADYRRPEQLVDGDVLLVGAGNSGAEIAKELAGGHRVWLAGRDTGQIPFRIERWFGRTIGAPFVLRVLFRRIMTVRTPIGRKVRPRVLTVGGPRIRLTSRDLAAAGVERVPRVTGIVDGAPELADGRVLDVANVIWCTGFEPGFSWIDLPVHGEHEPQHDAGIVPTQPGLYFVGLHFLSAMSSEMIHGVGDDAARVVEHLADRANATGESLAGSLTRHTAATP